MVIASSFGVFYQFGSFTDILFNLENLGFFEFLLPFLLVFAIVFGVLSYMQVFANNKGISITIALVFGFLAIRSRDFFFQAFLAELAPRLGVGLTILLAILVLVGLFTPGGSRKAITWILFAVGAIIFLIIITQTFTTLQLFGGLGFVSGAEIIAYVVMIAVLIGIIVVLTMDKGESRDKEGSRPLFELSGNR